MKYEIDGQIRDITQCSNDYSCTAGDDKCLCDVVDNIKGEVIFVKPQNSYCRYMRQFGFSSICHCPTRKEIYKRYSR
jgi:hypothetical protein